MPFESGGSSPADTAQSCGADLAVSMNLIGMIWLQFSLCVAAHETGFA